VRATIFPQEKVSLHSLFKPVNNYRLIVHDDLSQHRKAMFRLIGMSPLACGQGEVFFCAANDISPPQKIDAGAQMHLNQSARAAGGLVPCPT
jgi:hypothetical protein